jgi:hypothetical protein
MNALFMSCLTFCKKEDNQGEQQLKLEQNGYSVTVFWNGTQGRVDITSEDWQYGSGDIITITATANRGFRFLEWQQIENGIPVSSQTDNPLTFGASSEYNTIVWRALFVPSVTLLKNIVVSQYYTSSGTTSQRKHEYVYDSQNRLITGLSYNTDKYLIEYESCYTSARCTRIRISQNGNKITFVRSYHPTASLFGAETGEFELNGQGLPVKFTSVDVGEFITSGSNYQTSITIDLTWQNGNLTKTEWSSDWKRENIFLNPDDGINIDCVETEEGFDTGTNTYIFDDKKNPFLNCNTPKWALWLLDYDYSGYNDDYRYNVNNLKTAISEGGSTITTYEYTYNNDGFPVTRKWTREIWNESITETYTYH